jgi:hypothetical protein
MQHSLSLHAFIHSNSHDRYAPYLPEGTKLNGVMRGCISNAEGVAAVVDASVAASKERAKPLGRRYSLFTGDNFVSAPDSPILSSQNTEAVAASDYIGVPASVLLAYCIVRSWSFGRKWTGAGTVSAFSSKAGFAILLASFLSYLIPGLMREFVEVR